MAAPPHLVATGISRLGLLGALLLAPGCGQKGLRNTAAAQQGEGGQWTEKWDRRLLFLGPVINSLSPEMRPQCVHVFGPVVSILIRRYQKRGHNAGPFSGPETSEFSKKNASQNSKTCAKKSRLRAQRRTARASREGCRPTVSEVGFAWAAECKQLPIFLCVGAKLIVGIVC
jgi:hypothetical protein